MRRFQLAGHRPFPLAGGATGMVGDPGGRSEERNLLDDETLRHNVERIKVQLTKLLDFEPGPYQATLVNNADWTHRITMLEFLRDVGKHFTVNQMMAKDSVRSRLESEHGISYTEFSYMLLQANDFRHLYEHHDVELQAGASDQWGNIVAGVDLIRRRLGAAGVRDDASADDQGGRHQVRQVGRRERCGSTRHGPRRTSSASSGCRCDDETVGTYLKMLSLRPLDEIEDVLAEHAAAPEQRPAQRALADEMTTLVHGADAAAAAGEAADVLFGGDPERSRRRRALEAVAAEVPTGRALPESLDGRPCARPARSSRPRRRRTARSRACSAREQCEPAIGCSTPMACCGIGPAQGTVPALRKGKRDFVVGKSSTDGLTLPAAAR